MKNIIQSNNSYHDFDKENLTRRNQTGSFCRHYRVQSTFALNLRRDKSLNNTTYQMAQIPNASFQTASNSFLADPIKRQQRMDINKQITNDSFDWQLPSSKTRENSFNNTTRYLVDRIKTDNNPPVRPLVPIRQTSLANQTQALVGKSIQNNSSVIAPLSAKLQSPQSVDPYMLEILSHMIQQQIQCNKRNYNAFTFQTEITERMRAVLLDWIVDVHLKFKLLSETLFLTIYIIDLQRFNHINRALERIPMTKKKFQLFGITALYIAAKYEEVYQVPHIRDLVFTCDNAFSKQEILQTEGLILQTLNFSILQSSSSRFLGAYQEILKLEKKNYILACYLIELALVDFSTVKYLPNTLAAAAIYLVNKISKTMHTWPESYVQMTTLSEIDVRPCAKDLCSLLQNAGGKEHATLRKKYSQPKYMEVARIKIQKKPQQQY